METTSDEEDALTFPSTPGVSVSHHLSNGLSSVGKNFMGKGGKHKVKKN